MDGGFYVYYIIPAFGLISLIITITIRGVKKAFREYDILVKSRLNFELYLCLLIFVLVPILLPLFMSFYSSFTDIYPLLVPQYFNHWYELLWLDNIYEIRDYFMEQEMFDKEWLVGNYAVKLRNLLTGLNILTPLLSEFYRGLQRVEIGENAIYCGQRTIYWNNVIDYDLREPIIFNKNHYKIKLEYEPTSKINHFLNIASNHIKFSLAKKDYYKFDELISRKTE
ncbi:hypothetical protein [Natranaerobius thermophilus]|uniref:Uncharacterized protein n=1 Tax=Natranaerobius thermophilus (strain ATCC BAA-1301 / DSM 18059 / JW/NM-WN-LF) TaxID=457570 RepID=B2A877_NATTJ|nr:hypothetical protein [Natranaerobius thermophilus]ACB84443.1 hypothetical protein Nther_0858 [Natranaerobius thermophilus JW/NM-WN-LF]